MIFSVFSCTDFLQSLSQLKVVCHYVRCTTTYIYIRVNAMQKNHSVSLYLYSQETASTHFLHLNNVFWIVRLAKFAFSTYERHKLVELYLESRINCWFANNIWGSEKTINRYICLPCQVIKYFLQMKHFLITCSSKECNCMNINFGCRFVLQRDMQTYR